VCLCLAGASLHAQNNLMTTTIQRYFTPIQRNIEAAADQMPAEKYTYKITPDQMSFGEWVNHSTERNYLDCSTLRGEPNPMPKAKTDMLKQKAEIVKNVKESFAYCVATFDKLDDQKILSTPALTAAFLHTVVHNNEIYGNMVGYLRLNGVLPPSTAAMQSMQKGKK
jgi:hypothetical protein